MLKINFLILCGLICFLSSHAHRFNVDIKLQPPFVIIQAFFFAGQPVSNALVTVYSADDGSNVYQSGRTDKAGYFVFIPDKQGDWYLLVDDEKGHRRRTNILIDDVFFVQGDEEIDFINDTDDEEDVDPVYIHKPVEKEIPIYYRMIFGLALIFGLTGILYGIKVRQSLKK